MPGRLITCGCVAKLKLTHHTTTLFTYSFREASPAPVRQSTGLAPHQVPSSTWRIALDAESKIGGGKTMRGAAWGRTSTFNLLEHKRLEFRRVRMVCQSIRSSYHPVSYTHLTLPTSDLV